ncbi:hypothetical protein BZL30_5747 [Mycobacterium kansasii]|uniref:Uncharacterized protein n=1 Tax=Mycobacterium kansasii TaxID=1768 RepID=A0A1V3WZE8_MYCKA|nr:hypothetical protein BZL30_5747 [Mycobacterium kansasii]
MRGRLDIEALVTRRIGIDDVEAAFTDMAAGRGHAAWSASARQADSQGARLGRRPARNLRPAVSDHEQRSHGRSTSAPNEILSVSSILRC